MDQATAERVYAEVVARPDLFDTVLRPWRPYWVDDHGRAYYAVTCLRGSLIVHFSRDVEWERWRENRDHLHIPALAGSDK